MRIIKTTQAAYNQCYHLLRGEPIIVPGADGPPRYRGPEIKQFEGDELIALFPEEFTAENLAEEKRRFGCPLKMPGIVVGDDTIVTDLTLSPEAARLSYADLRGIVPGFEPSETP
jgi:hypothetical protein